MVLQKSASVNTFVHSLNCPLQKVFNWNYHIENIELAIFILFAVIFAIQLYYYLRIYLPALTAKQTQNSNTTPISVIICAKNEAENLKTNLKSILEQNHSNYEVIVVDDGSTDNTGDVLGEFLAEYKHLRTTSIPIPNDPKFTHGKKLAVTVGVKAAKNDWLVFTDADCAAESTEWLNSMQVGFENNEIVLGYGGYHKEKSVLNNFIRYETLNIALMYLGWAAIKKPYMGIGRNLAYNKELFFKNKGFASNYGLLSGDDDLFVNETCNSKNTTIVTSKNSFTRSKASKTWGELFTQKKRHLTTANSYKALHSFRIGMEPISRAWFYLLLIFLLTNNIFMHATLAIAGVKIILQSIFFQRAAKRFNEKNMWFSCIIFDVFSLFFNFLAYFALTFRPKQIKWK